MEICYRQVAEMPHSLVGRNIPLRQCGEDISINVSGNVSIWQCGKDTFTSVTKKHCGLDTYKFIIAKCAEMCLHGYVVKTHFIEAVQR